MELGLGRWFLPRHFFARKENGSSGVGDPDYMLMVVTTDLPAFQRLYDEELSRLPNVQRLISTLVMKHVITDRPLPFA